MPTADARLFKDEQAARNYVETRDEPQVVKAAGLAKGKGVIVCTKNDEALEAIILTALAKAPSDRFASVKDLANALERYRQGDRQGLIARYSKPYQVPERTVDYQPSSQPVETRVRQ